MIEQPIDILSQFPVRRSAAQKKAFRDAVSDYAHKLGYTVTVENGSFGSSNVVIGNPEAARYLLTAHYDTGSALPLPATIYPRNRFLFMLCQLLLILAIILPAVLLGIAAGWLSGNFKLGCWVGYGVLWAVIALILFGPGKRHNANDNTSGIVTLLEIARSVPNNRRDRVCFVLFDLQEACFIGSASYRKAHKCQTERQIVLNLDCVGEGDQILLVPTKGLKKDPRKLNPLHTCCGQFGTKFVSIPDKGFAAYPSDHVNFPYGVGICTLRKGRFGLYLSRNSDCINSVPEITNINLLRAAIVTYVTCTD